MPSPSPATQDSGKKPQNQKNRSPTRSTTPTSSNPPTSNVQRMRSVKSSSGSPMSAKGAARRPTASHKDANSVATDDTKAETAAIIDDLKSQLQKAESASEEYQKQLYVLQARLDEALSEQGKLEERSNESQEMVEELQKQNQDAARRHRDLTNAYENEKVASMKEKEEAMSREEEMSSTIQRLKDSLANRDNRKSVDEETMLARAASSRGRTSPRAAGDESSQPREDSQNSSKQLLHKDKLIETLRLELAEKQIRNIELENSKSGSEVQSLEKMLLEARMSNAKLVEDNESYQVLLSEKTLNGDFSRSNLMGSASVSQDQSADSQPRSPNDKGGSSLADELENADEDEPETQRLRKVESELSAQKDQNKALTLYINKIISRLLQSETFETLFENGSLTGDNPLKSVDQNAGSPAAKDLTSVPTGTDKELPPPPSALDTSHPAVNKENAGSTFLQRAGSIFGGRQKARPKHLQQQALKENAKEADSSQQATSLMSQPPKTSPPTTGHLTVTPAPNQDPATAPSLPLKRSLSGRGGHSRATSSISHGHRRATSDIPNNIANNIYKSPTAGPGSPTSATLSPSGLASSRRTSGQYLTSPVSQPPPPLILEGDDEGSPRSGAMPPSAADGSADVREAASVSDSGYGESVASKPPSEIQTPPPQAVAEGTVSPRAAASAALEGRPMSNMPERPFSGMSGASDGANTGPGGGRWFSGSKAAAEQNKIRPLRLVQEKVEADEAAQAERKKANRASFMGWFNRGSVSAASTQQPSSGVAMPQLSDSRPSSSDAPREG